MLVFRCECEQVLGVEDESSKGGLGECPTCGRIIRVPQGLINASGRLRLAGTPARASASVSGRDLRAESGRNGAAIAGKDTASKMAPIKTPAPVAKRRKPGLPSLKRSRRWSPTKRPRNSSPKCPARATRRRPGRIQRKSGRLFLGNRKVSTASSDWRFRRIRPSSRSADQHAGGHAWQGGAGSKGTEEREVDMVQNRRCRRSERGHRNEDRQDAGGEGRGGRLSAQKSGGRGAGAGARKKNPGSGLRAGGCDRACRPGGALCARRV